jgi:hypothetical protein
MNAALRSYRLLVGVMTTHLLCVLVYAAGLFTWNCSQADSGEEMILGIKMTGLSTIPKRRT